MPNRRQAIIWTNDVLGCRRIYVSLDHNDFMKNTIGPSICDGWVSIYDGKQGIYLAVCTKVNINHVLPCVLNILYLTENVLLREPAMNKVNKFEHPEVGLSLFALVGQRAVLSVFLHVKFAYWQIEDGICRRVVGIYFYCSGLYNGQ